MNSRVGRVGCPKRSELRCWVRVRVRAAAEARRAAVFIVASRAVFAAATFAASTAAATAAAVQSSAMLWCCRWAS